MNITDKQIENIKVGDYVGINEYPKLLWRVQHIDFERLGITNRRTHSYHDISPYIVNIIVTKEQVECIIHSECNTATRRYEEACL